MMLPHPRSLLPFAIAALSLFVACSSESSSTDTGGTGPDAGTSTDGGGGSDAASVDPEDPTCAVDLDEPGACGGDPTGTWTYARACSNEDPFSSVTRACQGATVSNVVYASGGTLTLNTDGTFTRTAHDEVSGSITVPAGCAVATGSCAAIGLTLQTLLAGTTATCDTNGGGGCDCAVTHAVDTDDRGTYTQAAGTITVNNGNVQSLYWYCAGAHVLKYRGVDGNPDRTSYVLTK